MSVDLAPLQAFADKRGLRINVAAAFRDLAEPRSLAAYNAERVAESIRRILDAMDTLTVDGAAFTSDAFAREAGLSRGQARDVLHRLTEAGALVRERGFHNAWVYRST